MTWFVPYIGATNAATANDTTTSLTLTRSSGYRTGDLMVTVGAIIQTSTFTTLSGWTQLATVSQGTAVTTTAWGRIFDGTEAATDVWTFTAGTCAMAMLGFRMSGTGLWYSASSSKATGTVSTCTPNAITGVQSTDMVLTVMGARPDAAGTPTITMPTTASWLADSSGAATATNSANFASRLATGYKFGGTDTVAITTSANCEMAQLSIAFSTAQGYPGQQIRQLPRIRAAW